MGRDSCDQHREMGSKAAFDIRFFATSDIIYKQFCLFFNTIVVTLPNCQGFDRLTTGAAVATTHSGNWQSPLAMMPGPGSVTS